MKHYLLLTFCVLAGIGIGYFFFSPHSITITKGDIGQTMPEGDLVIKRFESHWQCSGSKAISLEIKVNGIRFAESCAYIYKDTSWDSVQYQYGN